jgi:hypothetical protein
VLSLQGDGEEAKARDEEERSACAAEGKPVCLYRVRTGERGWGSDRALARQHETLAQQLVDSPADTEDPQPCRIYP